MRADSKITGRPLRVRAAPHEVERSASSKRLCGRKYSILTEVVAHVEGGARKMSIRGSSPAA